MMHYSIYLLFNIDIVGYYTVEGAITFEKCFIPSEFDLLIILTKNGIH